MKFEEYRLRGKSYDIHVNQEGQFTCTIDGETVKAPSLETLKKKLQDVSKRILSGTAIPFVIWKKEFRDDEGHIVRGVCTGIHAGNGNTLVRYEGKTSSEQVTYWSHDGRPVPPELAGQLKSLNLAVENAQKALEDFIKENALDFQAIIRAKLSEGGKPK